MSKAIPQTNSVRLISLTYTIYSIGSSNLSNVCRRATAGITIICRGRNILKRQTECGITEERLLQGSDIHSLAHCIIIQSQLSRLKIQLISNLLNQPPRRLPIENLTRHATQSRTRHKIYSRRFPPPKSIRVQP